MLTGYELSSISIAEPACFAELEKSALRPRYARGFQIFAPLRGSGRKGGRRMDRPLVFRFHQRLAVPVFARPVLVVCIDRKPTCVSIQKELIT